MATKGVLHMRIRMYDSDTEPIYDVLAAAVAFIADAMTNNGTVFVHCVMGMSRSPTLVAAYLMAHHAMNAEEAIKFLVERRPIVCPNDGFRAALKRWESLDSKNLKTHP
jgi:atypical dual specificity phosphatase